MRKFTLLICLLPLLMISGYSQSSLKNEGGYNPVVYKHPDGKEPKALCDQSNPSNAFQDGYNISASTNMAVANDLIVNENEDFILSKIVANIFSNNLITSVIVNYYDDNSGGIGSLITSETLAPTSQEIIGSNYGYSIREVVLNIDPIHFEGQVGSTTTYWVSISADDELNGTLYWEVTSASFVGNSLWYYNGTTWIYGDVNDGVYVFSGDCVPICSHWNVYDAFENAYGCGINSGYSTANDLYVNEGERFILGEITAKLWTNYEILSVDVTYYNDASGIPGDVIGSEAGVVPTSQEVIGSNFGYDIHETFLPVTPFSFEGPGTFWIQLAVTDANGTEVYWGVSSLSMNGNPFAHNEGAGWYYVLPSCDGIYVFSGQCETVQYYGVTFNADANDPIYCGWFIEGSDQLWLGTSINDWTMPGLDPDFELLESPVDNIYTLTLELEDGIYYYKYFKIEGGVPSWDGGEWNGDPNRQFTVAGSDITMEDWMGPFCESVRNLENPNMDISPNPSNGEFTIKVDRSGRLEVINIFGKLMTEQIIDGVYNLNIDNSGVYFLRFSNSEGSVVQRVVVK